MMLPASQAVKPVGLGNFAAVKDTHGRPLNRTSCRKTRLAQTSRHNLGIQSVEVAGDLIHALIQADGPLKLADLAQRAGMPSAKAHRYLVSLMRVGLARQDAATSRYDLGPVAFQLGLKGFSRFEPLQVAEATLHTLVDQVGETAALAVWGRKGPYDDQGRRGPA